MLGYLALRDTNPSNARVFSIEIRIRAMLGYLALRDTNPSNARVFSIERYESEQQWQEVESDAHARCCALNFNGDVQSYDARTRVVAANTS